MARKRAAPTPAAPTPARVEAALRAADLPGAVRAARDLHESAPTADNLALRKRVLREAADALIDAGRSFNVVLTEADAVTPDDPAWLSERAAWLAKAGKLADALARVEPLADPAARTKLLGHAADRAVRTKSLDGLPVEFHPAAAAVQAALSHHAAGDDEAARESIQGVGLQSPFLDWKLFVRGLAGYAAGDDGRARENWQRLDPARLATRLAAPLRAVIDPEYKVAQVSDAAAMLAKRYELLTAGPVLDGLRAVRQELGRDKPLVAAFRYAGVVLPDLKRSASHLVPRLANCFYHAIVHHGEPGDLPRYRSLFGEPPDDPKFHRLEALVCEQTGDLPAAHKHWQDYERWLAAGPAGWPPATAERARAIVWARMAENAARHAARGGVTARALAGFPQARRLGKAAPLAPPPADCLARAAALAPDWAEPALQLFAAYRGQNRAADAERIARGLLARTPDDLAALTALADLLGDEGRAGDAADVWLRASAVNPLDRGLRFRAASALLNAARARLVAGEVADAETLLTRHRPLLAGEAAGHLFALASVLALKSGVAENAEELRASAVAVPGQRLACVYRIAVDSQLAKLKPAQKTAATKRFKDALAVPPTPLEVNQFLAAADAYRLAKVAYRGQKAHEKLALDAVEVCLPADSPAVDFERLGEVLLGKHEWRHLLKLATGCARRFPAEPFFVYAKAVALYERRERAFYVEARLEKAKELVRKSADARHKALLPRIEELMKQLDAPFDLLGNLFGDFNA